MKYLFILLACLSVAFAQAQDKTIYYDGDWKPITDKSKAKFYRKVQNHPKKAGYFLVRDYYINGAMQMEADMTDPENDVKDGPATYYYESGKKRTEWQYVNNKAQGPYKEWYEDGTLEAEGRTADDKSEGEWKYYYLNGKLWKTGMFKSDNREGVWKIYNLEGKNYLQLTYNTGILTAANLLDKSNGMYMYRTVKDSTGKNTIQPFIDFRTAAEYKVFEPLIRYNLSFLPGTTNENAFVSYAFTMLWLSNNPSLGKFGINVTKFMVDYSTELEDDYKYSSQAAQMYILGLGAYLLDNGGKINDLDKFHLSGATTMLTQYQARKKTDAGQTSTKLEELLALQKSGKLAAYIKNYK